MRGIANPLYSIYNHRLLQTIRGGPIPRHLGVILESSRRFGRASGQDAAEGRHAGAGKIDELLEWCAELEVPIVTFWLLPSDSFHRDPVEFSSLLSVIEAKIVQLTYAPTTYERRYQVRVLGRLDRLPASTRVAIREVEERTRGHDGAIVNLAVGCGGREEIVDAVAGLIRGRARQGQHLDDILAALTAEEVARHLYAGDLPDPDVIIRTSGGIRLTGALLWQTAHADAYFCDAYWPSFRKVDFLRAVRSYQQRRGRAGGNDSLLPVPTPPAAFPVSVGPLAEGWLTNTRFYRRLLSVRSAEAPGFIDITEMIEGVVQESGVAVGEARVYTRHTSAGLTINENEPLLLQDMARFLNSLAPPGQEYAHNDFAARGDVPPDESANGHSHCQRLLLNTSESIPVRDGRLDLGVWQRLFLVELDPERERQFLVQVFGE